MSMSQKDGWIWFDGALKPWAECATHVLTHTLHYGLGVFEVVRAYSTPRGPAVFRLGDHTKRLMQSAHILGIETECRVGLAVMPTHYQRGWHITATCGIFGAAAAAGKLLGLDARHMGWALGHAATQSSSPAGNGCSGARR